MLRPRLSREIVQPYLAFAVASVVALVWTGSVWQARISRDALLKRMEATARAVAAREDLFLEPAETWRFDLDQISGASGTRLTIIDGSGTAIADTAVDVAGLPNFLERPEIRGAVADRVGAVVTNEAAIVAVAASEPPSPRSRGPIGFVRCETSVTGVVSEVRRWTIWSAVLLIAVALAGLVGAIRIASRLSQPLTSIARSMQGVASADGEAMTMPNRLALNESLELLAQAIRNQVLGLRRENAAHKTDVERLTAILAGMPEGILAADRDGRILFANPAASLLLDLPEMKLAGRPLWEAVRLPTIQSLFRETLAAGEPRQVEIDLPRTAATLTAYGSCLPGQPPPGAIVVLHDVTELRRLENLRREFVSNVSHELKTPLASIQAYIETLLDGAIDEPETRLTFLKRIAEQADRLHNLIVDTLRLARIEAGTAAFEIRKLDAGKLITARIDEHAAIAKIKGVTVSAVPPDGAVRLRADADGLRTILDNLLDNAIHYTPAGGSVAVHWYQTDDRAVIEVRDTGIGIPPEHLARIFERFHRVDQARSRERGGTGLGLAIVKHLAQVFDGRVEVESEVGRGSIFRVFLPAA